MINKKTFDKLKALIICKKRYNRLLIRSTLINAGIKGDAITDIEKCKDIYYKLTEFDFSVIVIDHDECTDFSYLNELKDNPYVKSIPVVIVTSQKTEPFIRKAIENGIAGIVLKPISAQSFKKNLEKIPLSSDCNRQKIIKKQDELQKSA